MKHILLALVLCSSFIVNAQFKFEENLEETTVEQTEVKSQASNVKWLTSIEDAKKVSATTKKPILVYFTGSDWCAPCIALKSDFFGAEKFQQEYLNDFVFVMIDYPRRKDILTAEQTKYNRSMIDKYNKSKTFPKIIMLDKNGYEMGKLSGYSSFNTYKDTSHHYAFVSKYASK